MFEIRKMCIFVPTSCVNHFWPHFHVENKLPEISAVQGRPKMAPLRSLNLSQRKYLRSELEFGLQLELELALEFELEVESSLVKSSQVKSRQVKSSLV